MHLKEEIETYRRVINLIFDRMVEAAEVQEHTFETDEQYRESVLIDLETELEIALDNIQRNRWEQYPHELTLIQIPIPGKK